MTVENDPAGYLLLKTHPNIVFLTFYLIDVILEKESLKKTAYIDEKTPPGRQPGTLLQAYRLRAPTMPPYTSCFAKTRTKFLPQDIYRVAFRSEKCLSFTLLRFPTFMLQQKRCDEGGFWLHTTTDELS